MTSHPPSAHKFYRTLEEYPPVPVRILNHPQFQAFMKPFRGQADPRVVYNQYLGQAGGSDEALYRMLTEFTRREANTPRLGAGIGQRRSVVLDNHASLVFTYVPINDIPQYIVEMRVQPEKAVLLRDAGPVHGGAGEKLLPRGGVYYMAINQVFRVRLGNHTVLTSVPSNDD